MPYMWSRSPLDNAVLCELWCKDAGAKNLPKLQSTNRWKPKILPKLRKNYNSDAKMPGM